MSLVTSEMRKTAMKLLKGKNNMYSEWQVLFVNTEYLVDGGRLCRVKEDKEGNRIKQTLANFTARILREIVRDNGQDTTTEFVIVGIAAGGRKLKAVHVPTSKFNSMSWAVDAWGAVANPSPGVSVKDYLRHAIQYTGQECERETVYSHLGWRKIDGKWYYLHGAGAIGDDEGTLSVDLSADNLTQYSLPTEPGDYCVAMQASLRLLELGPKETFYTLWATVFLSPLCEVMRQSGCEPAFLVWLLGHSGAMKSSVAALIMNHFGIFQDKLALPGNFKNTVNILERKSFLIKDSLFVVDDFHPPASMKEADQMKGAVQQLSRGYGDRHGRARMNADTTARKTYSARGMALITGEDLGNIGESAGARQIVIELQKGDIDSDVLTKRQAEAGQYAMAMKGFIAWLISKMDVLPKQCKESFVKLRELAARNDQHKRVAEEIAWLYMGFTAGLEYAADVGAISKERKAKLMQDAWAVFIGLGAKQAARTSEEKVTVRFINALNELLASKTVWVKKIDGYGTEGGGQLIGWYDDQYAYLITGQALAAIVKYYQAQGGYFNGTTTTLLKRLAQDGMIYSVENEGKKQNAILKKIDGQPRRVMFLKREYLRI